MNLFATPGLGSLMGGRILAGLGQLIVFLIGFAFVCIGFFKIMKVSYSISNFSGDDISPQTSHYLQYFLAGFMFAAVAWFWSLLTSLSMVRQAKIPEPALPGSVPPRLGS